MRLTLRVAMTIQALPLIAEQRTQNRTEGACSPVISGNSAAVNFTCSGVDRKELQRLLPILNRILKQQLDPDKVMAKLDELLARQKRHDEVLAEAKRDLDTLVQERAPRKLTAFRMHQLQLRLKRFAGTTILVSVVTEGLGGNETLDIANQIISTLHSAGWKVKSSQYGSLVVAGPVRTASVVINGCLRCENAAVLYELLKDSGLSVQLTDSWTGEQPSMSMDIYPLM